MLRALKPFFELIIYTDKPKDEAEAIINEIEKEQNFFTYIIPVNYCYYLPQDRLYVKELSIFMGNRHSSEICMISTQPYDSMLLTGAYSIPIVPFIGDEYDLSLVLLE